MATLQDVAERHRDQLLAGDARTSAAMARSYRASYKRVQTQVARLETKINKAREDGEEVGQDWLARRGRLDALAGDITRELAKFTDRAADQVTSEQRKVALLASAHAQELTNVAAESPSGTLVRWNRLPDEVVTTIAGFLADGSPLSDLLNKLAPEGADAAKQAIKDAVIRGTGPVKLASEIRSVLGVNLAKAQTIARTEVLRAYRETTRRTYVANSDVVLGWTWHATLGPRTCAACWAMHGTKHKVGDSLDGHPNCRCAMVPITPRWEDIGLAGVEDVPDLVEDGEELFARQPAALQRQVLGPAAYEAYARGDVKLASFVGQRRSDDWGTTRYTRSLKRARSLRYNAKESPGTPSNEQLDGERVAIDRATAITPAPPVSARRPTLANWGELEAAFVPSSSGSERRERAFVSDGYSLLDEALLVPVGWSRPTVRFANSIAGEVGQVEAGFTPSQLLRLQDGDEVERPDIQLRASLANPNAKLTDYHSALKHAAMFHVVGHYVDHQLSGLTDPERRVGTIPHPRYLYASEQDVIGDWMRPELATRLQVLQRALTELNADFLRRAVPVNVESDRPEDRLRLLLASRREQFARGFASWLLRRLGLDEREPSLVERAVDRAFSDLFITEGILK